jgi:predicted nucleic acid-binding protein
MPALVLDASVAIAWIMPDEDVASAQAIRDQVTDQGAVVPSLWRLEVANILLQAERARRVSGGHRDRALALLMSLPIAIDQETSRRAWLETIDLAQQHDLTTYDACYLELALRLSLPLATFDQRLAAAGVSHRIRILGA